MALFWPAYEAWLAEREGDGKLLQRVMLFNLFWSVGVTLGPAVSGYLYQDVKPFKPFYIASVVGGLTLISFLFQNSKSAEPFSEIMPEQNRSFISINICPQNLS